MSHSEVPPPPGIWSVPAWTGRNLAARDVLLAEISGALAKRGIAPLCGLGGAGKSMLAIEYAHRNAGAYDTVFFVRADSTESMDVDFMILASEMRLLEGPTNAASRPLSGEGDDADPLQAIAAVRSRLGRRGRWLLIFDNVREPKEVDAYVPGVKQGGHVIMTSRNPIWRGVTPVSVRGLERAESVSFLLRRTGEADVEAADALAEELGDLPLALTQAGAYIEETGRPLVEYLTLFRRRPGALLERPLSFPVTVATTWESSLAEVFGSQVAAELLSLCSFLPMEQIPRRMLGGYDPVTLDDAIATLRLHSLIDVRPLAVSVHRLVKVVVRNQLRKEDQRAWAEAARHILHSYGMLPPGGDEGSEGHTEPDLP